MRGSSHAAGSVKFADRGGHVFRQNLVDEHLIESLDGARLELCVPRSEGSVLRFDRPWEGAFSGYATVLQDGERFLLYYRGLPQAGGDGEGR